MNAGTALALSPAATETLARVRVNARAIAQVVAVEPFTTAAQVERANALLRLVETYDRDLETARKAEKEPSLRASQAIDRAFKADGAELERVSGILRKAIAAFRTEQENAKARALETVSAAAARGDAVAANLAVMSIPAAPALEGTAERWTYEIEAVEDLAAVPVRFLALDMPAVRAEIAAANKAGRPPAIPGIRFKRALALSVGRL